MMIILFISAVLEYKKIEVYFIYDLVFYIHCNPSYCTYIACRIPCCPHPLLSICPPDTPMSQPTEKKCFDCGRKYMAIYLSDIKLPDETPEESGFTHGLNAHDILFAPDNLPAFTAGCQFVINTPTPASEADYVIVHKYATAFFEGYRVQCDLKD